jgi:hypothetical protein
MFGEKEYLDAGLDGLLTAISGFEVGGWYAGWQAAERARAEEAAEHGEPSYAHDPPSSKGNDKVADPDWEDILFNPVPITPLSSKPRFAQVVGSSSEAMAPPRPQTVVCGDGPPGGEGNSPSRSDGNGSQGSGGNGGGDGAGDAQQGAQQGAQQQPLAYNTAAQFNQMWDNCATDLARQNLEQQALNRSQVVEVQFAAILKYNLRLQARIGTLAGQVGAAQAAAAQANVAAANAQAVAQAAGNADRFRPAARPKYGNKKKDADIKQWIPVIENYLRTAPDADYIRLASSYLECGPRSLWTTVYEAYKTAHACAEPGNPRVFFRETMKNNYGLQDLEQKHWDTWNGLWQGPSQDIAKYNIEFQQALTDLAGSITDEQVKIKKYRGGLQYDLRQLCMTSPTGARWGTLQEIIQYATPQQWPIV